MKKKISVIAVIFVTILVLLSSLFVSASTGLSLHKCPNGVFDPIITVAGNTLYVNGCFNCSTLFTTPAYMSIETPNGTVFDPASDYQIKFSANVNLRYALAGTDNEIVVFYEGRNDTDYAPTTEKPREEGEYYVALSTKERFEQYLETGERRFGKENKAGQMKYSLGFTDPLEFTISHTHTYVYYVENGAVYTKCTQCGKVLPESACLNVEDGLKMCCYIEAKFPIIDTGVAANMGDSIIRVYEGSGSTQYALSSVPPTGIGEYCVSLVPESIWNGQPDNLREYLTAPVKFYIDGETHEWTYRGVGFSLIANCMCCSANAKVTLDSSAVYENARALDADVLTQELFYDENWSLYTNIAHYSVLYNGKMITSANGHSTTQYYNATRQPTNSGNYVACLAILKDPTDVSEDSIIAKSEGMPFYVAGYSLTRCTVTEYGPTEIAQFTKPQMQNDEYLVGTLSELLWCVYNQQPDMTIRLTNDIIVNPITVTDNGNVSSGALLIYKWKGFGTQGNPFTGNIYGDGHTVYGLYVPEYQNNIGCGGLVNYGKNVYIDKLTIESSYIKARESAGAFFGHLEADGSAIYGPWKCKSLHNVIISDGRSGGFIGSISAPSGWGPGCFKCVNDSSVSGNIAGGFIGGSLDGASSAGLTDIDGCINYGSVTGNTYAGGIIGELSVRGDSVGTIKNCMNVGYVKSENCEAGIIASITAQNPQEFTFRVLNCISAGSFYMNSGKIFDIVADFKNVSTDYSSEHYEFTGNSYFQSKAAYNTVLTDAPEAEKLTSRSMENGILCQKFGHVKSAHFSDVIVAGCENGGSKNIRCYTCGTILETYTTSAHGHYYQGRSCFYCHKTKSLAASFFSEGSWIVTAVVAGVLLIAGATIVIVKKKKKKAK